MREKIRGKEGYSRRSNIWLRGVSEWENREKGQEKKIIEHFLELGHRLQELTE